MRSPWPVGAALVLVALLLVVPLAQPMQERLAGLSQDLARGRFHPFGATRWGTGASASGTAVGGLTGSSLGSYLPGGTEVPDAWPMDRDGTPGAVTIDFVFEPDPGAMKRLKAYDAVDDQ